MLWGKYCVDPRSDCTSCAVRSLSTLSAKGQRIALRGQRVHVGIVPTPFTTVHALEKFLLDKDQQKKCGRSFE